MGELTGAGSAVAWLCGPRHVILPAGASVSSPAKGARDSMCTKWGLGAEVGCVPGAAGVQGAWAGGKSMSQLPEEGVSGSTAGCAPAPTRVRAQTRQGGNVGVGETQVKWLKLPAPEGYETTEGPGPAFWTRSPGAGRSCATTWRRASGEPTDCPSRSLPACNMRVKATCSVGLS